MAYPELDTIDSLEELLRRKEFYEFKADPERNFRDPADDPLAGKFLKIHSHQLFVRNFMNPNTPYKRLHLLHATGTGKTLAAISVANEFIKIYKKIYEASAANLGRGRRSYAELDRSTPTVFVLGFAGTRTAFIRDLLTHPEFGFISLSERDELMKRTRLAAAGLPDDIKHLSDYISQLKKRITLKAKGGFYKFYGYDEFVNRLFKSDTIKLTDLEAQVIQRLKNGEQITLEDVFRDYIERGEIQVNESLLKMFENSLLICDEIHNTYNSNTKNNRGVAIQYILDTVPSVRFLSMSATPINNSPSELVELLNYLLPPDQKLTKRQLYAGRRKFVPGWEKIVQKAILGKVSFLQDINPKYFPRRVFRGKTVRLPREVEGLREIPYLKFIECPMSNFHQQTYEKYTRERISEHDLDDVWDDDDLEETFYEETFVPKIPADGYSVYDIVFPNPDSDDYGVFRSSEVKNKILSAPQEWRDRVGVYIKKYSATNSVITGSFLSRENISRYSSKFAKLLDILDEITESAGGDPAACQKIMIYHDRVKMSGVLLVQELLKENGYLDEFSEPVDSTRCAVCGVALGKHSANEKNHKYYPARFVIVHSDMDKGTLEQSRAKFNSPDNATGLRYKILVGSKIIKESYDFKDVQNLIILSLPTNIPILLQVLGRCIRKFSHINLPPERWVVNVSILLTTAGKNATDPISPELYRYVDKMLDYMMIQKQERVINSCAVDADIHRDIVMPPELLSQYFPDGDTAAEPVATLGNLYFEPAARVPKLDLHELNLSTFEANKHYDEEIKLITYLLKRLFMERPVWMYDDLWRAVREPPFGVEVNPKLFQESNFIIALQGLVYSPPAIISTSRGATVSESYLVERLLDHSDKYIYKDGQRWKVEKVGDYYVLFPMSNAQPNPLSVIFTEYLELGRDKERTIFRKFPEPDDHISVDVETYLRPISKHGGVRVGIASYLRETAGANYESKKRQFLREYSGQDDVKNFLVKYPAQFQIKFTEEAIEAAIKGRKTAEVYSRVISLLSDLGVIIYVDELSRYKDMAKHYERGIPKVGQSVPLGFMTAKSVRLYDPTAERWFEVNKVALNRQITYKENEIIVGYLESSEDGMKFKLRKPIHKIREEASKTNDIRLVEKGIVCSTKNKDELVKIASNLGIKLPQGAKVHMICDMIKTNLLNSEIKERKKDSRYKYLYSWWDDMELLRIK